MTNGLRATLGQPVGHDVPVESGRIRSIVLALLVTLSLALLSTAAAHFDGWATLEASGPQAFPADVAPAPIPVRVAPHSLAPGSPEPIEALAALVAKKYRISPKVGRELIGTAYREGARTGVDPLLIIAVMAVESRFNPIAESDAGAMGLMQVIPGFHKDKLEADAGDPAFDPHANIRLGARVLQEYIRRAGNEAAGLQLYNGSGDDATNAYANKVLAERQRLQQAIQRLRDRLRA
jgi:soluble lytic murein transglycosylase-like protein